MMLEKAVSDCTQAIVGARARVTHGVLRAWIVESGENDESAIADVPVGMLGNRLQKRRHGLRRDGSADRTGRGSPDGVVKVAEFVDSGFQLVRRDGLRSAWFLRREKLSTTEDTEDTEDYTCLKPPCPPCPLW